MTSDIRDLIGQHHVTYEVLPYYVVVDVHKKDAPTIYQKVQAGFDIDLYGTGVSNDLNLSSGSDQVSLTVRDLQEVAEAVKPPKADSQLIEVIPFETTLYLSPSHHLEPEALVRIRITHSRGLDQPAGPLETQTVNAIERQIQALGVRSARGSVFS
jgi:hypothetical protein